MVINNGNGVGGGCSTNWEIVYVPPKPQLPPHLQPTVDAYASLIDPKLANILVRKLNQLSPLENLRHVKRVRKQCLEGKVQLSVILCLTCGDDGHPNGMPGEVVELINSYQLTAFVTKVSKYAATSKEEWEEQCKLWPTSYHPPTYNIDGITGFREEDSQSIFTFMKFALDLAKSGAQMVNAAVIVDPSAKQVVASAHDEVLTWDTTMNKTTMETCCVGHSEANNSHLNVSGVDNHRIFLSDGSADETKQLYNAVSCLHPWNWAKNQLCASSSSWHPLRHAAIVAIENSAARDRHLFPRSIVDKSEADDLLFPSGSRLKRQKKDPGNAEDDFDQDLNVEASHFDSDRPYLCTGYDIYLVWEPCTMCAMALVHQRVRRIFYAFPNRNAGALGSVHRLQGERSLNHHYAVFRILLPENLNVDQAEGAITAKNEQITRDAC